MKKLLASALVVGLIAVPSLAFASHGADDGAAHNTNDIRQEDRRSVKATTTVTPVASNDDNPATHDVNDDNSVDDVSTSTPSSPSDTSTTLTADQAVTLAESQFPNKTLKKVETEAEHGVAVFSVRFTDGSRVDVDASTGALVRVQDKAVQASGTNNSGRSDNSGHGSSNSGSGHGDSDD